MFAKINSVESGYFWGKSWYFNEKSLKNGKSQIRNSFFLIHCNLLLLKTLRYNLSTKNIYQNQPRGKWLFLGKNWYFNEKSQKMENLIVHHVCRYVDDNSTCRDVWKEKLTFSCIIYIYFSFFLQLEGDDYVWQRVQFVSNFFSLTMK